MGDLFLLDLNLMSWIKLQPTSGDCPSPRSCFSMMYNHEVQGLFVFGGVTDLAIGTMASLDIYHLQLDQSQSQPALLEVLQQD